MVYPVKCVTIIICKKLRVAPDAECVGNPRAPQSERNRKPNVESQGNRRNRGSLGNRVIQEPRIATESRVAKDRTDSESQIAAESQIVNKHAEAKHVHPLQRGIKK